MPPDMGLLASHVKGDSKFQVSCKGMYEGSWPSLTFNTYNFMAATTEDDDNAIV